MTVEERGFQESLFESITFGEKLETLGSNAFYKSSLAKITFQNSKLKTLPYGCFCDCSSLKEVILPGSLERIESGSFVRCYKLEEIILPDGFKCIEDYAFQECKNLKGIVIPTTINGMMSYLTFASGYKGSSYIPNIYYKGETAEGKFDDKLERYVYLYSEETPKENGRYWHYVDGKPAIYK